MKAASPVHWRLRQARYRLHGNDCVHCGRPVFPLQPYCTYCREGSRAKYLELGHFRSFFDPVRLTFEREAMR